ncbi:hypothetical protein [Ornithinibacillus scapharcae]|uniref:hypothetical protein n=1 Tax=Ornithinibacillus scapharcae TaxID=1147159 RepID=UPI000225B132|nr:hypothetical protein [Ornithinibacillus scapharcae]
MSNEEFFTNGLESRVSRHKKNQKKKRYMLIIIFTLILAFCMAIIPMIVKNESALSKSGKQITISHVASHINDRFQLKKVLAHPEVEMNQSAVEKKELLKESNLVQKEVEVKEEKEK